MKPRTAEAARLEADYLARVREALRGRPESQIADIIQSVSEHIEEAVAELKGQDISLVQMAQVVERLGAPGTFSEGPEAPSPAVRGPGTRERFAALLDRIWAATLVRTVGIFIPFIDFYVCALIGHGMLAYVLRRRRDEAFPEEFRTLGRAAGLAAIATLVHVPLAILALVQPAAGALTLPTGIALAVLPMVVSWKLMGGIASVLRAAREDRAATATLEARRTYLTLQVIILVIAFAVGIVLGVAYLRKPRGELELVMAGIGLALLPLNWIMGYVFLLRPIGRARRILAEPSVAAAQELAEA